MLLLSLEPTRENPPTFDPRDPALRRRYEEIVAAARSDLGGKLPTKWESYSPVLPATRANAAFVYVLNGDWMDWAQRRFRIPPQLQAVANRLRRTPTLRRKRELELEALLKAIEAAVARDGLNFHRTRMPGRKDQFKRFIKARCPRLENLQGATLDEYIKGAGCKYPGGRNRRETDFWERLRLPKPRAKRTP